MEEEEERDGDADRVVEMGEGEAAISDAAIDPFGNRLERREGAAGAEALDGLAMKKGGRISNRADKTKQVGIVFEPPMRKGSQEEGVVDDGGEEKENPVPPVREGLAQQRSRRIGGHRRSSSQASSSSNSASGSQ